MVPQQEKRHSPLTADKQHRDLDAGGMIIGLAMEHIFRILGRTRGDLDR